MRLSELIRDMPGVRLAGGSGGAASVVGDVQIERVIEDSRLVRHGDLFVARSGVQADGSRFISDAVKRGAVAVVLESGSVAAADRQSGVAWLESQNAAEALGLLAHRIAGNPADGLKLLAVTGTNGKTTTAYMVRAGLSVALRCGLIGTVQIDDGVSVSESTMTTPGPVELAELFGRMRRAGLAHSVLEASSHALHQQRLAGLRFAVGMFSNLTGDHLDYHGSMENYAAAKAMLFENLDRDATAVVNADDAWAPRMLRDCTARQWRYGLADGPAAKASRRPDFCAQILQIDAAGTRLKLEHPFGPSVQMHTGFVGRHNAYNLLCALSGLCAIGVTVDDAISGLQRLDCVPGRLQPVVPHGHRRGDMPFQVFVDYAHTHDALENVLQAIRPWTQGRVICMFGCGGDRDATKRPKMAAVAERLADEIIVTSDNPRTEDPQAIIEMIVAGFSAVGRARAAIIADRRKAIEAAIAQARPGDVVLLAGKGHENYQIVGREKHPFDDAAEAKAAIEARIGRAVEV